MSMLKYKYQNFEINVFFVMFLTGKKRTLASSLPKKWQKLLQGDKLTPNFVSEFRTLLYSEL